MCFLYYASKIVAQIRKKVSDFFVTNDFCSDWKFPNFRTKPAIWPFVYFIHWFPITDLPFTNPTTTCSCFPSCLSVFPSSPLFPKSTLGGVALDTHAKPKEHRHFFLLAAHGSPESCRCLMLIYITNKSCFENSRPLLCLSRKIFEENVSDYISKAKSTCMPAPLDLGIHQFLAFPPSLFSTPQFPSLCAAMTTWIQSEQSYYER